MPTLREIAKIKKRKINSNTDLFLRLKMQPLSEKTKRQAEAQAFADMSVSQRDILNAKHL